MLLKMLLKMVFKTQIWINGLSFKLPKIPI